MVFCLRAIGSKATYLILTIVGECESEKWGDREMGRWGDGGMGRWGESENLPSTSIL